ncbi:LacI family transcriptional regulator [Paramixta manurensis]|uniref:LacI family transcriptional regulator n=1 Tax=Paramixta manurensis TaxID=2740817 RepID=A0A6M8UGR6_9GAMM|nr:LacI family transcriptional regulator [Erwiniaceae bacterium PD-1]
MEKGKKTTRRMVTAYDVARVAGVSQSAVSRTFTPGASVSKATRQKVMDAAASLGYRPNFLARSLISQRSNLIGVVVPGMANPFYAQVLEQLAAAFEAQGYRVLLFSTASNEDSDPVLEEMLHYQLAAVILLSASLSSRFADECRQIGMPVLLVNRKSHSDAVSSVTTDNRVGGAKIAEFLIAGGHQRFAFLAGRESSSTSAEREQSFRNALLQHDITAIQREVGGYDFEAAAAATRRLLAGAERPDALFCANDLMALAALNVSRYEFDLQPGRDISIVGFDSLPISAWPVFDLTTYVQPVAEMVMQAVAIINAQLLDSEAPAIQCEIEGQLIVRGSARQPPGWK